MLVQIPHHGSKKNHQINFWKKLEPEINTPAVVSVGNHGSYNHPNVEVIKDFNKHNYKVYATNHINGMEEFLTDEIAQKNSDLLDFLSEIRMPKDQSGDQIFVIKDCAALSPNSI